MAPKHSRTNPLNPLLLVYNLPSTKEREMPPQPHVRGNSSSFNNSFNNNSFNNTISITRACSANISGSAYERDRILARLSPLEPRIRHDDIRAHRVEHVGDWLLRTEEYGNWFNGIRDGEPDNSALFCYGDPGVGKTYIT